jgi:antagonist of KipI
VSVLVLRPGLLSTIQDLGRYGFQHLGIVPCGAMDSIAHCLANALVGNEDECATLECTIAGPELRFEEDALVALYGAAFKAKNGTGLPGNRPVLVNAGMTINVGSAVRGSRAYLAIAGGFSVPPVLGSRSTYVPGSFGGFSGRALRAGDRIETSEILAALSNERFARIAKPVRWSAPELTVPPAGTLAVRAIEGRHWAQFDEPSRETFFSQRWRVSATSNRMGYRLEGPRLARRRNVEVLSEPTCLGTVQVPNDGTPIALMADHQTTGGYPKIAEIASADLPEMSQLAPGDLVRFVPCTLEQAQRAEDEKLARLRHVRYSIRSQF